MILASEAAVKRHGLTPRARVLRHGDGRRRAAHHGHRPGAGDAKLLARLGLKIADFDVIELNEAFASQALACCASWASPTMPSTSTRNGGAIALGHPLGMSRRAPRADRGARAGEARRQARPATMCIGVGQGVALAIEKLN